MKHKKFYIDDSWTTFVRCNKCEEFYPISNFYKKKNDPLWVGPCCKKCYSQYIKSWQRKNYNKVQEAKQKYRDNNKETIARQRKTRKAKWVEKHGFSPNYFSHKIGKRKERWWRYPTICPICWSDKQIEFHHPSYEDKTFRSRGVFCCKHCHEKIHTWEIECPRAINLTDLI